jgi:hypothetical protein
VKAVTECIPQFETEVARTAAIASTMSAATYVEPAAKTNSQESSARLKYDQLTNGMSPYKILPTAAATKSIPIPDNTSNN